MDKLKNVEISMIAGLLIALLLASVSSFGGECDELRQNVLRLHILANSDEPRDQQIKLEARDAILEEFGAELGALDTKQRAEREVEGLLGAIEETARAVIRRGGRDDAVKAEVVNMYFDTRCYGSLTMPAGRYDAVRVTIGEAKGHNWWCVLYPPVCISAAGELEGTVAGENPKLEPRFKLVEWWEKLRHGEEEERNDGEAVDNRGRSS